MTEFSGVGATNSSQQGSSPELSQNLNLLMANADFTGTGKTQGGTFKNPQRGAFRGT